VKPEGASPPPSFGEEDRRLSYGSYLKVPELLSLQDGMTDAHDELLFIVVHQVYELWFKVLLHELEAAREAMFAGEAFAARHSLRRVKVIERLLVEQLEVLETMSPQDFLAFRAELAPASGFQSVQFRELEFLSGLKNPAYLKRLETDAGERARLERRLREPTLWDAYLALVDRQGSPTLEEILRRRQDHAELFDLAESLLDHDEAFAHWRSRHVLMVERQIGDKTGTGGSTGAEYLRTTLGKRFYPALWGLRSQL
jgi:tryptophan 2,3-dioxygenase